MPDVTFKWSGVAITAREGNGWDMLKRRNILRNLPTSNDEEFEAAFLFASAVALSTVEGKLPGVEWPPNTATPDSARAAQDAFMRLPIQLVLRWETAIKDAAISGDTDLYPAGDVDPKGDANQK